MPPLPKPAFPCQTCLGWSWSHEGYVPPDGTGANGVLMVFEAAGEQEALVGRPLVGKAGLAFVQMLQRGGLRREDFRIANVLSCRPPNNKLRGAPYEHEVVAHCAPLLDAEIARMRPRCILAGGDVALGRLLGMRGITDCRGYVFWSDRYQTWIIPTYHPAYIMRGKWNLEAVFIHDAQRAVEVARDGWKAAEVEYLLDPTPREFEAWVEEYESYIREHPTHWLSTDIETIDKGDAEDPDVDESDKVIVRIGFSYKPRTGVSIPYDPLLLPLVRRLLEAPHDKLWWHKNYDVPILRANGHTINGTNHDGMVAWHVLHSDLPKNLGFVTTFACPDVARWKHLSHERPAFYNATDVDTALRNTIFIVDLLKQHRLYDEVYVRHVLRLEPVCDHMSRMGMPVDPDRHVEASQQLTAKQQQVLDEIRAVVPWEVLTRQPKNGYVRSPKDTTGMVERPVLTSLPMCPRCKLLNPPKAHFKVYKKKENPCGGLESTRFDGPVSRWFRLEPFVPSPKQILSYQQFRRHAPVMIGRGEDRRPTTDEKALKKLVAAHLDDPLYPLILEYRELATLTSRYVGTYDAETGRIVGGMPIGADGRVHTTFTQDASTLRMTSKGPNLQNIPRGDDSDVQKLVKLMFVAPTGLWFWAVDYSGIEAVLVGVLAGSQRYTRLARLGVHAFFMSHVLGKPADLAWDDEQLGAYLKAIKASDPVLYEACKRTVHLSNYRGSPRRMFEEYPKVYGSTRNAGRYQQIYYDLFPELPAWHRRICRQVDKAGYYRNPYNYLHHFYRAVEWHKVDGVWEDELGDESKRVIACGPQGTAAGVIKEAGMTIFYDHPKVGQDLRLFIHDEIFGESPQEQVDSAIGTAIAVMTAPIPELPLDPSWGLGSHLSLGIEAKVGRSWGEMQPWTG